MNGLDTLREWFPWPDNMPDMPVRLVGWLHGGTRRLLQRYIQADMRCVVEIGSWLGKSASFLLRQAPEATVICIDTWLGNMHQYGSDGTRRQLQNAHRQFLRNLWDQRHRVIPVRATSIVGLQMLAHLGIKPDAVFVDGSHETDDVRRDILGAVDANPEVVMVGDDWQWPKVQEGVKQANALILRGLRHTDTGWVLL